jgi:hypothetical protein
MECRCNELTETYGTVAEAYAHEHLHRDQVRSEAFEEDLSCPDTGFRYSLDYPERTQADPGQARLRRM